MNGRELTVNGEKVFLSNDVIAELHRQERIEEGQNMLANYVDDKDYNDIVSLMTDDDYESITLHFEEQLYSDNGPMEKNAVDHVLAKLGY